MNAINDVGEHDVQTCVLVGPVAAGGEEGHTSGKCLSAQCVCMCVCECVVHHIDPWIANR